MIDWMLSAMVAGELATSALFAIIGLFVCAVTIKKTWRIVLKPKVIATGMRLMCILFAIIGLYLCAVLIPYIGLREVGESAIDYAKYFWPWLAFAWVSALPCFGVLVCIWLASGNIGHDTVFTLPMSRIVGSSALMMAGDGVFLISTCFVLSMLQRGPSPIIGLLLFLVSFGLIALGALAGALSHYIREAAILRENNEGLL